LNDNYLYFFERNTDAVSINRGFYYQYLKTLKIWLDCFNEKKDITIICENEEDIKLDLISSLVFKQIKCYKSSFSLSSIEVKKSIVNFFCLFRKHEKLGLEFIFETNSTIKDNELLLLKWYKNQLSLSDEILKEIKKNVENILIKHAESILESDIALDKNKITKLEKISYPKNIIKEGKRLKDIKEIENHIEVLTQKFVNEKIEVQSKAEDFIRTIRWKFDGKSPEQAVVTIEDECKEIIKKIDDLKHIPKIIFDRLLSEVIRKSQSAEINDRKLNIEIFTKIINESDSEIKEKIDNKITNDIKDDIDKLKIELKNLTLKVEESNKYDNKSKIPIKNILEKFDLASHILAEYNNEFIGVQDSHIIRNETQQLANWIEIPIDSKKLPIALLVGNAGMGKSVILKDLLKELQNQNIPVLGLKTDRIHAKSIVELQNKVNIEDSFEKIIYSLRYHYDKVVILIDQLDALSQSLSANREYLDTFNHFIRTLSKINGVRIIISLRTYDLNYDVDLQLYKKEKIINIKLLEIDQVKLILQKLGVNESNVTQELYELLRVPLNLNVFSSVYKPYLNIGSIKTLHHLYNEFWNQKIINNQGDNLKLKNVIYTIADNIDLYPKSNNLNEEFNNEIQYLKSNNIIIGKEPEIQFFHQTFFDYVFAKQFIDTKKSILDFIKDKEQGLFIRSRLKMIISFLKDTNIDEYIRVLDKIIISKKYRFHLKLLLLNSLGFENKIDEKEKAFVKSKILTHKKYRIVFIESVFSTEWFTFLANEKQIEKLLIVNENIYDKILKSKVLNKNKIRRTISPLTNYISLENRIEILHNLCFKLFINQFSRERIFALELIEKLPEFNNKQRFVNRLLYFLKIWDSPLAFKLFEKYTLFDKNDRFGYCKIIEDVAHYDFDWAIDKFQSILNIEPTMNEANVDYQETHLLEELIKLNKEKSFILCLNSVKSIIKQSSSILDSNSIYVDSTYWYYNYNNEFETNGFDKILKLLIDLTISLSGKQSPIYKNFVAENITNNSQTILCVLIHGFLANPTKQLDQILKFITIFYKKGEFNIDSGKVHYFMRKLLNKVYPLFSQQQKDTINIILHTIKAEWETEVFTDNALEKRVYRKLFGLTKYQYIRSIPIDEINNQPDLKKVFQELERKYFSKNIEDNEPNRIYSRAVPAPLNSVVYKKMKNEEWENTFIKFNDKTFLENGLLRGSLMEHKRAFQKEVAERPEYFYPFIKKLINENRISFDYIIYGFDGLKDANFDSEKLKQLYKDIIKSPLDRENTLFTVWASDYLIKNNKIDNDIANYLCNLALKHHDPEKDLDPRSQSLNSVRGAACCRIIDMYCQEFSDLIITTLNKVLDKEINIGVRIGIAINLCLIFKYDKENTLSLFLKLVNTKEIEILKYSVNTARFLSTEYFKELIPFFKNVIEIGDKNLLEDIVRILTISWLNGNEESFNILKSIYIENSNAKAEIINVAIRNIFNEKKEIKQKCYKLFELFLKEPSKDIVAAYSFGFHQLLPEKFQDIYFLLKKFSKSKIAKNTRHEFYSYLLKCLKSKPTECLILVSALIKHEKYNPIQVGHFDDEPVNLVIGIYNELRNSLPENKAKLRKCLNIFDEMLQLYHLRNEANKVMNEVDS